MSGHCRSCAGPTYLEQLRLESCIPSKPTSEGTRRHLHSNYRGEYTDGFTALQRAMEHVVPGIWFAPFLRLPGLNGVANRLWKRGHPPTEDA